MLFTSCFFSLKLLIHSFMYPRLLTWRSASLHFFSGSSTGGNQIQSHVSNFGMLEQSLGFRLEDAADITRSKQVFMQSNYVALFRFKREFIENLLLSHTFFYLQAILPFLLFMCFAGFIWLKLIVILFFISCVQYSSIVQSKV